jgi:hypothetical protein
MRRSASSTRSCSIAPFSTGITKCCYPKQRLCSAEYETNFLLLLLVLLTSVGALVYKVVQLQKLPQLWATRRQLGVEAASLAERRAAIECRMQGTDWAAPDSVGLDADAAVQRELTPIGVALAPPSPPVIVVDCIVHAPVAHRVVLSPRDLPRGGVAVGTRAYD